MIDYGGGLIFPDAWAQGPPDPPEGPDEGDIIGGRFQLEECVFEECVCVMDEHGVWRCPKCSAPTGSYGHRECDR